ncbi:hypothetical protein [Aulosira sp. FACHB-615]|nr:hypothetical protein [Aulosira sp. FACHB-615]
MLKVEGRLEFWEGKQRRGRVRSQNSLMAKVGLAPTRYRNV